MGGQRLRALTPEEGSKTRVTQIGSGAREARPRFAWSTARAALASPSPQRARSTFIATAWSRASSMPSSRAAGARLAVPERESEEGLAGNHGPPHWQASSAGETPSDPIARVVSGYPRLVAVASAGQYPKPLHHQRGHNFFGSARARRGQQPLAQEWRNPRASAASSGGGERVRHWRHGGGRGTRVEHSLCAGRPVGGSR